MNSKLNIGIAGAGWPSWQHIRGYKAQGECDVVALCDPDTRRLKEIADQFEIPRRYENYDEMLKTENLDVVSVCTPNAYHSEMAIAAMKAGAHVHCEKPMAMNSDQARNMIRARSDTGKVLMIGFQRRFGNEAQYLKRFIDSGAMGQIYHAKATWVRRRGIPGLGGWFTTRSKSGGGALIDIGVHVLDLVLWFMNFPDPVDVMASAGARFGNRGLGASSGSRWNAKATAAFDVDDFAFAHVRLGEDRSISLEASWAAHIREDVLSVELWGDEAGARIWPLEIYTTQDGEPVDISPRLCENDLHVASVAHFINVVKGREELICLPEEGIASLGIIERIYASAGIPPGSVDSVRQERPARPAI